MDLVGDVLHEIGVRLADPGAEPMQFFTATVDSVTATTATVHDASGTSIPAIPYLLRPAVGAVVVGMFRKGARLILGTVGLASPGPSSSADYAQHGSTVQAYATGGMTINFPTAFPNNLTVINATPGDSAGSLCQCQILRGGGATDRTKFKVACYTNTGVEVTNATNIRIDWTAWGN